MGMAFPTSSSCRPLQNIWSKLKLIRLNNSKYTTYPSTITHLDQDSDFIWRGRIPGSEICVEHPLWENIVPSPWYQYEQQRSFPFLNYSKNLQLFLREANFQIPIQSSQVHCKNERNPGIRAHLHDLVYINWAVLWS